MRLPEYDSHDALGLAELVRRKQVTPVELVEAAIDRIERRNPALNAIVHRLYDEARAIAACPLPEGPFTGVPFLLKDLIVAYAGAPLESGCRFYRGFRAARHSTLAQRFLASGLVVVGKTATPELGLAPVTEPETSGPVRNPWDPSRTAGGSSGGSAAAVAARMVPMAGGGDGGGSIRIPAACCGVFGFKPSRGRIPDGPHRAEIWQGFATEHVLTLSVRDSAAMLDAAGGPEPGAFHTLPPPPRPFLDEVSTEPGRLRIAWSPDPYLGPPPIAPECRATLEDAVTLLGALGHEMVEARPPLDREACRRAFLVTLAGEAAAEIRRAAEEVGRRPRAGDFEIATWLLGVLGRTLTAEDYARAVRLLKLTGPRIAAFMADHRLDALLSPTLGTPPPPIGAFRPPPLERAARQVLGRLRLGRVALALGALDRGAEDVFRFIPFTGVFNATGQPSMSVPLYWTPDGLPIGVMLTGRHGDDATLFRLAGQLERARPWRHRLPPVVAWPSGRHGDRRERRGRRYPAHYAPSR